MRTRIIDDEIIQFKSSGGREAMRDNLAIKIDIGIGGRIFKPGGNISPSIIF